MTFLYMKGLQENKLPRAGVKQKQG